MGKRWIPEGGHVTRAGSSWFFTGLVIVVAGLVVAGAVIEWSDRTPALVLTALTGAYAGWAVFGRPRFTVTEQEMVVVNPVSTAHVPWSSLVDVDTRFQLGLVTRDRVIRVQAAPSPGGFRALRAAGRPQGDGAPWKGIGQRPGDDVSTDSGGAASIVRGYWQQLVETGELGPEQRATVAWDRQVLVTMLLGVLLSLAAWIALAF